MLNSIISAALATQVCVATPDQRPALGSTSGPAEVGYRLETGEFVTTLPTGCIERAPENGDRRDAVGSED